MHKVYKWFVRIASIVLFISLLGAMVILALSYDASDEALDVLEDEDVRLEDGIYILEPSDVKANIVIYQGGLVQTEAYLVLAQVLKDEGYRVFLPKMPLNLAILSRNKIEAIINDYPSDLKWIGIGHSLGGASLALALDKIELDALIFLASYPPSSVDLSESTIDVLSITASEDYILDEERFEETKSLLPNDTVFEEIQGGNHAGFGYYGDQRDDGNALISKAMQHQLVVDYIIDFLSE
ncbi:MAG: alpha/beta hydrolase [Candidatus Izemoplasmataceae bacterium]